MNDKVKSNLFAALREFMPPTLESGSSVMINEAGVLCLRALAEREKLDQSGHHYIVSAGLAVSDRLAGRWLHSLLAKCHDRQIPPEPSLIDLSARLNGVAYDAARIFSQERQRRAQEYLDEHPTATLRDIAEASGAKSHTTVREWLLAGNIERPPA